jgi:hypothetical protein
MFYTALLKKRKNNVLYSAQGTPNKGKPNKQAGLYLYSFIGLYKLDYTFIILFGSSNNFIPLLPIF